MKWSINEINKKKQIDFEEKIDLTEELKQRSSEILDVDEILVKGQVVYDQNLYVLDYRLDTVLTLPSSRSLKPVAYPLSLVVDEIFALPEYLTTMEDLGDENLIIPLEKELINLDESVADNILLEIPLQVLAEDEKNSQDLPAGNFWTVLSEDDYQAKASEKEEKKSPFAGLDGLFD